MVNSRVSANSGDLPSLIEWFNCTVHGSNLPKNSSWEDFRSYLLDGTVLCSLLEELCPGFITLKGDSGSGLTNLEKFLIYTDEIGFPRFVLDDLMQGQKEPVLAWLRNFKTVYDRRIFNDGAHDDLSPCLQASDSGANKTLHEDNANLDGGEMKETCIDSKSLLRDCSVASDKIDISDANIMKLASSTSFHNVSMRTLFDLIFNILDESIGRKNGYLHNMANVVKRLVQLLEQRVSSQVEKFKDQNSNYRRIMSCYQAKLNVFESFMGGSAKEFEVLVSRLEQSKIDKSMLEENQKLQEQNLLRLKEELHSRDAQNLALRQEHEAFMKSHEFHSKQLKREAEDRNAELDNKLKELELSLTESRRNVEALESFKDAKVDQWRKKERNYRRYMDFQLGALKELKFASESLKIESLKTQKTYAKEFKCLGTKFKDLADAAECYHSVLAENRKLYNEVQDLKGNIRVYCRIRPFLSGQCKTQTTIEYIGDNGEVVISNPLKSGKDGHRMFRFNKVFSAQSSQEEVFLDTQPLIRSVLDGYNVCIFAYGQTGSGKTYTMSGPCVSSKEDWGVNYRALHDLFEISQSRRTSISYEVCVQMVEIYNEQVRDLLVSDGSQRRLGIWSTTQPNGLAVPEASMHHVSSTEDVMELMEIGLVNRAVGATALNERSSRSHSVLTIHVRGSELKSGAVLRGSLHLVDLAGSERVDRSEATGDRLREAQHINKSLSALGDVIFALAQKSPHVPYRNSKLTQVLQSSLGGQAKTLMFVQLNPDVDSFSETISTLKFAERVSGVELGAARVNSECRDYKDLMEQVATLRNAISQKDREIERLQNVTAIVDDSLPHRRSHRHASSSPPRLSASISLKGPALTNDKGSESVFGKDSSSNTYHSESFSMLSTELSQGPNPLFKQSKSMDELWPEQVTSNVTSEKLDADQNFKDRSNTTGFVDADSEDRLSDFSVGSETNSVPDDSAELPQYFESSKAFISDSRDTQTMSSKLPRSSQNMQTSRVPRLSLARNANLKPSTSTPVSAPRRGNAGFTSATRRPRDATKVGSTSRVKRV